MAASKHPRKRTARNKAKEPAAGGDLVDDPLDRIVSFMAEREAKLRESESELEESEPCGDDQPDDKSQ